jgi:predicted small secreted protein
VRTEARFWLALAALLAMAPILSACHTVHGVGEDVSAAGRGISHAADKAVGDR